jgi:hypothetical protein
VKFTQLRDLIKRYWDPVWDDRNVWFEPGPNMPDQPVDYVVNLSIDGGLGLQLDGVLDNVSWQVKVSGTQSLYQTAEDLAFAIDKALLSANLGRQPDDLLVVSIYRVGGAPQHFDVDDAERTYFVCSYFFDVESGLQPI